MTVDPATWWELDSYRHDGHTVGEALAFGSYLQDQADEVQVQVRRDRGGVVSTVGLDIPRPPGRLRRLLGW